MLLLGLVAGSSLGNSRDWGWGGVNDQRSLHPQCRDWVETLEQGTGAPTAPRAPQHKLLPSAPVVCSRCVCVHYSLLCVCVCVCALGRVKCRTEILSMGHHTWPHITSFPFLSFFLPLLSSETNLRWYSDFNRDVSFPYRCYNCCTSTATGFVLR